MPKRLITFVPQGCYMEIAPSTRTEYIGLMTAGMSTCYPVVVTGNGYIFLCHADGETDISNATCGVPAWVGKVSSVPDGEIANIYFGVRYEEGANPHEAVIIKYLDNNGFCGKYRTYKIQICNEILINRDDFIPREDIGSNYKYVQYTNVERFINGLNSVAGSTFIGHPPFRIFHAL